MPLEGHWERVNTPIRRLTPRESRLVAVFAALLVACALGLGLFALVHDGSSDAKVGCIEATGANVLGGSKVRACGEDAARWCRIVVTRDDPLSREVRAQCREAGYR
jgi:hypothetical protein